MTIEEGSASRVADKRAMSRQHKEVPFLIRDDGMLFPNVPLLARRANLRPYHGDLHASMEERRAYVRQTTKARRVINTAVLPDDAAPFDIAKATKGELIAFAEAEYGYTVDPATELGKVRTEVTRLANLSSAEH